MLLAVFAAPPRIARAQDLSCGAGDLEVRALKFTGNSALKDNELALRVLTTPSFALRRSLRLGAKRCLNRAYLQGDLAKLELFYLERGYYSAKADTVIERHGSDAVSVTFRINEGPVTTLRSYSVTGLSGIPDSAAIMRGLRLRTGRPFDVRLFLADLDSITRHLRNIGYYRATTLRNYRRDSDSLTASVQVMVVPGPRARFGAPVIHVTPLEDRGQQVPDDVVRRVIGISSGLLFSDHAITEAQRNLYQLGVYRHVEVLSLPDSLQPPGDSIVVLDVRLSEDYMKRVDSEYGWATLDCGRLRVQYTDQNFLRSARRFELTGQASKIGYGLPLASATTRSMCTFNGRSPLASDSVFSDSLHYFVGASFRQPRLLGTRWVPTLSLYSERRGEYKAYLRTTNVGADASAIRDIAERTQLRVGYSQEYGRTQAPDAVLCALFSRCDDASRADITKLATLGVASAAITWLATDNLVSPTRGSIMRGEFRTSGSPYLGTSKSLFFHKGSVETAIYVPLGASSVLSFRVRAGAVESAGGSFIPPQERLYAGGPTSIRGFQQNELGNVVYIARNSDVLKDSAATIRYHVNDTVPVGYERVVPLGGNRLIVANLEFRVPDPFILPNLLQYTFFVDAGDAWNRPAKPALKLTPGLGLRLITPIGPMQMNFGYNRYGRPAGPMYFEDPARVATGAVRPDISPLYCVSPNNTIALEVRDGVIQPPLVPVACPNYVPLKQRRYERLTITFSIGPDF